MTYYSTPSKKRALNKAKLINERGFKASITARVGAKSGKIIRYDVDYAGPLKKK